LFNGILIFEVIEEVIQKEKLRKVVALILMNLALFGNTVLK